MLNYAHSHGIDKVFMLDDDITRLDFSVWDDEKSSVRASGTVKGRAESFDSVFLAWEKQWTNEALYGITYRPYSWGTKKENLNSIRRQQIQQCVGINVKQLYKNGITYRSSEDVGNEDLYLQYEVYKAGLQAVVTPSLQYDCPAMGQGSGGCNDGKSLAEKQQDRVCRFLNACNNDPMVRVSTTRSGVPSIKFNWSYIDEFGGDNNV